MLYNVGCDLCECIIYHISGKPTFERCKRYKHHWYFYNKTEIDAIAFNGNLSNYYNKTEVDATVANFNFSNNHYTKTEVDAIDDELSALFLNIYTKAEVDAIIFTTNSEVFSEMSIINLELGTSYLTNIQIADAY